MPAEKIVEIQKGDRYLWPLFFEFTKAVFPSADFKTWIERGYWTCGYTPHALVSGGRIISNVGATPMDIYLNGEKKRGVQIGTVGTVPEWRNRGFSRQLMDLVMAKYEGKADIFFLFANETVLDFYPKFGFHRVYESLYCHTWGSGNSRRSLNKLSLDSKGDRYLIDTLLKKRSPLTKRFGARGFDSITWWHLINVYKDDIYYWKEKDLILIMYSSGPVLNLIDIISSPIPDPDILVNEIAGFGDTSSIRFHFPPDILGFPYHRTERNEDTMLFVRGKFDPAPGFKFPVTAQT